MADASITSAYVNYLGRTPQPSEISYWDSAIQAGTMTSQQAVAHIQGSAEAQARSAPSAQVTPGPAQSNNQISVYDYASNAVTNPGLGFVKDDPNTPQNESMFMTERQNNVDPNAPGTMLNSNKFLADGVTPNPYYLNTNTNPANGPTAPQASAGQATAAQAQYTSAGPAAQGTAQSAGPAAQVGSTATATADQASQVDPRDAVTYDAQQTFQNIMQNGQGTAAQGTMSQNALITAPQADMQGLYSGTNADGSTNWAGKAINDYASQNMSNVIDTSTATGKALAEQLGEGNYLDSKATMKGQLEILQKEFTGPNGEPKIPSWAAGTARAVGRIAAFNGVTGTAATAAMAQALLEASMPIAQADSQFFQTLTLQNMTNKQAMTLNKANVLAKFELTNLDNRMTAAVENAKSFLQLDLANLSNKQQMEIVNMQARVQGILEDAKAINTQRMFTAQSVNEQGRFYDNLNSSIQQFNTAQMNAMKQFNASETNLTNKFNANLDQQMRQFNTTEQNAMSKFNAAEKNAMAQFNAGQANQVAVANAQMQTQVSITNASLQTQVSMFNTNLLAAREEFNSKMAYNIDIANANWRQEVTLHNSAQNFEANSIDVKNMVNFSQEQLNQIWDTADSLLNYAWQSSENAAQRDHELLLAKFKADTEDKKGTGAVFGTILGDLASSVIGGFNW